MKCVSHMWCVRVESTVPRVSVPYTPQSLNYLTSFEAIHVAMLLGSVTEWVGQEEVDNFRCGVKSNFGWAITISLYTCIYGVFITQTSAK